MGIGNPLIVFANFEEELKCSGEYWALWKICGWKGEREELGLLEARNRLWGKQWEFQWRLWVFYGVCSDSEHSSIHHTISGKTYIIYLCRSGKTTISTLNLGCHHFFVPEYNFIGTQSHIPFSIVCSCFHVTMAELNSCNRDQ